MKAIKADHGISICLDVGITQTRAWALQSGNIVAKAKVFEGIRGSIANENRAPAINAIHAVIVECLEKMDGTQNFSALDFISAAGMITSELGPYPVSHIPGPAGMQQLSANIAQRYFSTDRQIPLYLVPGIRFGNDCDPDASDAIRGEETLVMGMLAIGHLAPGDALLNLGSHWKFIGTNTASEIIDSYTGMGGELMLAVSRETILKNNLPSERPDEFLEHALKTGRDRASRYGLSRTLFLSRMDSQRRALPPQEIYWQLAGALIYDALVGLRLRLAGVKRLGISGYLPLAQAWAETLSPLGIESRIFSDDEVESSFCAGLRGIVAAHCRQSVK
ncbi:MAG TPA: 2-dehydro-3-deoxygalactonokinase [Candidatus Saccharimonadales bacterium]|jgi:2-dehydro-3-deoxygalactonokinase|nr:2-dehydro-3-deoxygalactonokinase [Candidatus Saccharimonadales bacterium]